ncbi:hypothetical protein [Mycoplasmopsis agassizii]|uniref:Baculovirus polyhedron envelope protein, PEP, C terminus n=1 Tax=Mycoplasmopsis agassizii TaxID=33922 RepID=A0ABX4H6I7_9BACT|nr:hypothetical protein [Mycoplasmopsis agassizii]PAF55490.1 hypothetical protein CJF60_02305 [Mycoplasmopsis agassizii]SMC18090.1 hypothetical protein SAMN02745179_00609 [Mycoplasmopsis agassizii]
MEEIILVKTIKEAQKIMTTFFKNHEDFEIVKKVDENNEHYFIIKSKTEKDKGGTMTDGKIIMKMLGDLTIAVNGISTRLDKVESRLDKVEERLDNLEARLDKVESRLDNLETTVNGLIKNFETLSNVVSGLITTVTQLANTVAVLSENVEKLNKRVDDLTVKTEEGFKKVWKEINFIKIELSSLRSDFNLHVKDFNNFRISVNDRLEKLENDMSYVKGVLERNNLK